ncbi:hypothetical protein EI53_02109 [Fusobacterium naviforme]|nr:hypothetical protein EI53_02109 [Fusobacterium naviforme]STO26925.1 Uncharacterised protein [Fusobacterium naviforme]
MALYVNSWIREESRTDRIAREVLKKLEVNTQSFSFQMKGCYHYQKKDLKNEAD